MSDKLKAVIYYLIDKKRLKDMTPKKLQKILYYCYSWNLVFTAENDSSEELKNSKLFPEVFEAWVHGPVVKVVYNKYKNSKASVIETSTFDESSLSCLNADELENIDEVIEIYGDFTGNQLEDLTHEEEPWREARGELTPLEICTEELSDKTIYNYYGKLVYGQK